MANSSVMRQSKRMKVIDCGDETFVFGEAPVPATSTQSADDATVKATAGTVYAVIVSGVGVTAGDSVVIKDNTTAKLTFVYAAANETIVFNPSVGITFATSIKVDVNKSGGTVAVDVIYI